VVAVPADATTDMEENFRHIHENGSQLVCNAFRRVEMPRIQTEQRLVFNGVTHVKLVGADDVTLTADAEELALDGVEMVVRVEFFRKHLIE
jgi:hypothetical protein